MPAMTTLLRSLVVWLMLLAVPFQAYASATMMPCAPQMHDGASPTAMGASHAHAAMVAPGHDHAAMTAAMAHDAAAAHHPTQDYHAARCTGPHAKCDCAACYVAAVLASTASLTFVPALDQLSEPPALYADFLPAVDLAHPERPPQGARA